MNIHTHEITDNGYVLLDKLEHSDLVPFLKLYLNKRTIISAMFYGINGIFLAIAIILFVFNLQEDNLNIVDWTYHYFIGFSAAFLLIPLHEYIHVVAYKSQGATNTSYDANLKKFYFMALADKFVANKKEFRIIALAPFTVISALLLLLLIIASYAWTLTILGTLLCHTAMCSGDFGLLSYFDFHKDKDVITYDDVAEKTSYFYGKTLVV